VSAYVKNRAAVSVLLILHTYTMVLDENGILFYIILQSISQ